MLTPQEIVELRRTVASHQHLSPGMKRRIRFEGGTLDGMMISLDAAVILSKFVGWAKQGKARELERAKAQNQAQTNYWQDVTQ